MNRLLYQLSYSGNHLNLLILRFTRQAEPEYGATPPLSSQAA